MPERVIGLAREMSELARDSVAEIQSITAMTRMLSINALIEAGRAGAAGAGFSVVAREVRGVSTRIREIATGLGDELIARATELDRLGQGLVADVRGQRLTDLALNMIEIIDRNLYERSCDVRWWATDSAIVDLAADPSADRRRYAAGRLATILDSYTVYLDLWVCDLAGNVLATGRESRYQATGRNVANEPWFRQALATRDGTDFAVTDVEANTALASRHVATYAAAIRTGGATGGQPIGVLGIFFDWQAQAQTVVDGVRLSPDERARTRCLILDSRHRVIAASDRIGLLTQHFPLTSTAQPTGNYADADGAMVAYALTPGYETYRGLGWYGVISQTPATAATQNLAA